MTLRKNCSQNRKVTFSSHRNLFLHSHRHHTSWKPRSAFLLEFLRMWHEAPAWTLWSQLFHFCQCRRFWRHFHWTSLHCPRGISWFTFAQTVSWSALHRTVLYEPWVPLLRMVVMVRVDMETVELYLYLLFTVAGVLQQVLQVLMADLAFAVFSTHCQGLGPTICNMKNVVSV